MMSCESTSYVLPFSEHPRNDNEGKRRYINKLCLCLDGHISSTVHHCGDDLYSAKLYVLAEETFKTECVVKGPKKDFTIVSKYVHVPAA
mmetsp:Transcript_37432/g.60098  ORF Transcript_37432/g.60098 Transcript_37432/m.60098 type:complete len:89 (+) Transcript_37432:99-365(+)